MTTIGLVSAGLLTFPQGLIPVFGANIGTTGTGWLVAAFGVRISLTAAALPIVFIGALMKVVGRGRLAAAGAAIAGFALILVGLSTLQQGMGGLAESLHPSDLPTYPSRTLPAPRYSLRPRQRAGAVTTTVMRLRPHRQRDRDRCGRRSHDGCHHRAGAVTSGLVNVLVLRSAR